MLITKETPRWLMSHNKPDVAKDVLRFLRGPACNIDKELNGMVEALKKQPQLTFGQTLQEFRHRAVYFPVLLALGLAFFQQFSGINAAIFYAAPIFSGPGEQPNTGSVLCRGCSSGGLHSGQRPARGSRGTQGPPRDWVCGAQPEWSHDWSGVHPGTLLLPLRLGLSLLSPCHRGSDLLHHGLFHRMGGHPMAHDVRADPPEGQGYFQWHRHCLQLVPGRHHNGSLQAVQRCREAVVCLVDLCCIHGSVYPLRTVAATRDERTQLGGD